MSAHLLKRIQNKQAEIVIIGAGYVGLPLAVEVATAGFKTTTIDKQQSKVDAINAGSSYIGDVPSTTLAPLVKSGKITATTDPDVISRADVVIICVPTPLNKTRDPDNSYILDAAGLITPRLHKDQLIVLESTTFPGFSREVLAPTLAASGLVPDQDFYLSFSPERVDPGNPRFHTKNTPKVIGASSPIGLECAKALYACFIDTVVPVSSTDTAEMVKLLENTFRAVNIGLVNEIAMLCQHLHLDTWEVIEAASTKPFGFMPFFPGPGLGGHCIPVDPLYLSWKMKTMKVQARFIELADQINSNMPAFVVQRVADALNLRSKPVKGSKILVCGVAYKRDIDDMRESPAIDVIELLHRRGAEVSYCDPHVHTLDVGGPVTRVEPDRAGDFDCVVITTDHRAVDHRKLVERAHLVVDTRNATKGFRSEFPDKIICL